VILSFWERVKGRIGVSFRINTGKEHLSFLELVKPKQEFTTMQFFF
jgi:hypothetical protein